MSPSCWNCTMPVSVQWRYPRRTWLQPYCLCPSSSHCHVVSCLGGASLTTVDRLHAGQDGAGSGIKAGGGGGHEAFPVQGKPPPQVHHRAQVALNTMSHSTSNPPPGAVFVCCMLLVAPRWRQHGSELFTTRNWSSAHRNFILLQQQQHPTSAAQGSQSSSRFTGP